MRMRKIGGVAATTDPVDALPARAPEGVRHVEASVTALDSLDSASHPGREHDEFAEGSQRHARHAVQSHTGFRFGLHAAAEHVDLMTGMNELARQQAHLAFGSPVLGESLEDEADAHDLHASTRRKRFDARFSTRAEGL
ncbi:MAG: hypothetical protein DHS20C15_01230 [Planctomycetota bacterium]|nr:MAG: hypothetical protein DHS20C15_01230 [Planctomycetota bacterium]